jgi:hypothetical protein
MDVCTRLSHQNRQMRGLNKPRLAVFLCLLLGAALPAQSATGPDELAPEQEETSSIAPSSDHEMEVGQTAPGQEMVTLSARLTDQSSSLAKDVSWRVVDDNGAVVLKDTATSAAVALKPGFYQVTANFGAIKLEERFTLLEGNVLNINFVLNAGALRVLPRLKGIISPEINSTTRIFALSGKAKGQLVNEGSMPGEVVSLTAGQYRIESRMMPGNAQAVLDVKVKTGVISAVEIDHRAGLARLSLATPAHRSVVWDVMRGDQLVLTGMKAASPSLALQPGAYTAVAHVDGQTFSTDFDVVEGGLQDVILTH